MAKVTAQDFLDAMVRDYDGETYNDGFNWRETRESFEALLSQVRAQAHAEGRREGLKEMDETWDSWYSGYYVRDLLVERHTNFPEDDGNLLKLREEYQQPRSDEKETQ